MTRFLISKQTPSTKAISIKVKANRISATLSLVIVKESLLLILLKNLTLLMLKQPILMSMEQLVVLR